MPRSSTNWQSLLTPGQCRAARGLLGWSQITLAQQAGVAKSTIVAFEGETRIPSEATLRALRGAIEAADVKILPSNGDGAGVRFRGGRNTTADPSG